MAASSKTIHIQYFALLREERGVSKESYATLAENAQQLFDELACKYSFTLPSERLRVSINEQFESWDRPISENDRVVFIPPVAGG